MIKLINESKERKKVRIGRHIDRDRQSDTQTDKHKEREMFLLSKTF